MTSNEGLARTGSHAATWSSRNSTAVACVRTRRTVEVCGEAPGDDGGLSAFEEPGIHAAGGFGEPGGQVPAIGHRVGAHPVADVERADDVAELRVFLAGGTDGRGRHPAAVDGEVAARGDRMVGVLQSPQGAIGCPRRSSRARLRIGPGISPAD